MLLTGRPDESDRQLAILQAPGFGVVGEPQTLELRVDDAGRSRRTGVPVTLRQDGKVVRELTVRPGAPTQVPFTPGQGRHHGARGRGRHPPGRAHHPQQPRHASQVNGVRDRLRVLVVSGQPYPGLRVWRNLLKADPAVDLVHFTILRPPEKQDGTPIRELALIAFPSRELFEVKLKRVRPHHLRQLLAPRPPAADLPREHRPLRRGGRRPARGRRPAVRRADEPLPHAARPRPAGPPVGRGLRARLHAPPSPRPASATRSPPTSAATGEPEWGRWFRQLDVEADDGQVLMTGVSDRPLLVLKRVGEGRVAQLLSDHAWLWARGFEGGGPQALLLRRLVHWLMKEPQLEEEALRASAAGDEILVERQSLTSEPVDATVTTPSGRELPLQLEPDADGTARARFTADEDGVYRIAAGEHTAYATPAPDRRRSSSPTCAPPTAIVAPAAEATGGTVRWLAEEGVPDLRRVEPGRRAFGRGWLGIERHGAYRVLGMNETPLLPAWLALALLLGRRHDRLVARRAELSRGLSACWHRLPRPRRHPHRRTRSRASTASSTTDPQAAGDDRVGVAVSAGPRTGPAPSRRTA